MADYNTYGFKYGSSTDTGSAGELLSWSIDTTIPASYAKEIKSAFDDWSKYANIQFNQVSSDSNSTIKFAMSAIDGLNNTVGTGGSSYYLSSTGLNKGDSGHITFDSGEGWHLSGNQVISNGGVSLFIVALHEIGHVLGLAHYDGAPAVMNTFLSAGVTDLTTSDIDGIQYLYGRSSSSVAVAVNAHNIFDANYYNSKYIDVANSGIDPATHYNTYGWHEGRNPDPLFSTTGYLAVNSDVTGAGSNPLFHFDQFGWKEGRDPSADFDTHLYLMHNPDVKAAGIDPLQHYLQYGQVEGRQIYGTIGAASAITHGSFDPQYYLLANADVAKAAIAAGGDTLAFAYRHYATNGWQEHRNGDAYFDATYYLAHNSDVAAAHLDPLTHYDTYGWKEGRDPSAAFHTNAYLAANPDVAAAHVDPLTHYLQHGADEGRPLV